MIGVGVTGICIRFRPEGFLFHIKRIRNFLILKSGFSSEAAF